jgi:hypothetical protein
MRAKGVNAINEEMIGTFKGTFDLNRVEVYKNPQTLRRLKYWVRACSDEHGNLYVADSYDILHFELAKFLALRGIFDLIDWQRYKNTNTWYLAEGYDLSDKGLENELDDESADLINRLAPAVKERHKQFKFIYDKTILRAM